MFNSKNEMKMKRIINILVFAFLVVSCIEEQFYVEPMPGEDVSFSANINKIDTKTLYGKDATNATSIKVKWVDGDLVQVYGTACSVKQAEYSITAKADGVTNTPNENDGLTEATSMDKTGAAGVQWGAAATSDFYAIYPSSAVGTFNADGEGVKVKTSINPTQYNSFSKNADNVWLGTPFDFSNKTMRMNDAIMYAGTIGIENGSPVNLIFKPFSTVLKFRLSSWEPQAGSSLASNPNGKSIMLKSIKVSAPYAISGDFDLGLHKNTMNGKVSVVPEATINESESYTKSNSIDIVPAEQISWMYGDAIEFSVFTIPVKDRSLGDVIKDASDKDIPWTVTVETSDGTKKFILKPSSTNTANKPTLLAGAIHKIGVPGLPIRSDWEYSADSWIEDIPRNIYLSELSLPGAWYATDKAYQGSDIGLLSDSEKDENGNVVGDGIDDGLQLLYARGIRAFNIDCRLSIKPGDDADNYGNTYTQQHYKDGKLVLACAGSEEDRTGTLGTYTGEMSKIGLTVEDALISLGKLISGKTEEYIEVILTISDKPKSRKSGISSSTEHLFGTVDPKLVLQAISDVLNKDNVYQYLYKQQITPNTVVNDVLGQMIVKVNVNASDESIKTFNVSGPMLVSEGSMATDQYGNSSIKLGNFEKEQVVSMYWGNKYPSSSSEGTGTIEPMYFYYHQCQNTESSSRLSNRKSAVWEILKAAREHYDANSHNSLYQIGIGGWTSDNNRGKGSLAQELNPFVDGIITAMLNGTEYTFTNGSTTETQKMSPSPVGAVLMNFATKDTVTLTDDGFLTGGSGTYTINSSSLIKKIIELNNKCPMSRDENKPAWPKDTETQPASLYADVGNDAF